MNLGTRLENTSLYLLRVFYDSSFLLSKHFSERASDHFLIGTQSSHCRIRCRSYIYTTAYRKTYRRKPEFMGASPLTTNDCHYDYDI